MSLPDGLYKIIFSSPEGQNYGVAYLHGGKWRGGDSGMAYVGTYRATGGWLSAEVTVTQHRHVPGVVSALGYNDLTLRLEGEAGEYSAEVRGTSRDMPSVRFTARLSHIAD
ncbi:GrlR family regulatory protein [Sphingomonas jatrophae]|uniref:T3SS negative regulator,GrlR n=1 Tax=Sphingomonas jatrophae TaxID=1166337 RepID=A0A1I6M7H0_9SPHN|nr:GrlR family regulatory protein [Sphingomonas jatrophae]SFS11646.1 T3SS negative regulator,GrlR [Sphingomonas jatrophae]